MISIAYAGGMVTLYWEMIRQLFEIAVRCREEKNTFRDALISENVDNDIRRALMLDNKRKDSDEKWLFDHLYAIAEGGSRPLPNLLLPIDYAEYIHRIWNEIEIEEGIFFPLAQSTPSPEMSDLLFNDLAKNKLFNLPPRAKAAFGLRCARRAHYALLDSNWGNYPELQKHIEVTLQLTEAWIEGNTVDSENVFTAKQWVGQVCNFIGQNSFGQKFTPADSAAHTAHRTIRIVQDCVERGINWSTNERISVHATYVIKYTRDGLGDQVWRSIKDDLQKITDYAKNKDWSDQSSYSLKLFVPN